MKNLFKTINLCFATMAMLFMYSCQQDEVDVAKEVNGIEFTLSGDMVGNSGSSQRSNDEDFPTVEECDMELAAYARILIENKNIGFSETFEVPIKNWGGDYKTNLVELDPDDGYQVRNFQVFDEDDNILYATPMTGSTFGKFVDSPLPLDFSVEEYRKIEYDVEVLCVEDFTPPEFGFAFWNIDLKETMNLCIFANFCEPDFGHRVATLDAYVFPDSENTNIETDLIWSASADGDYESETEENELLCLKFPYDPDVEPAEQTYFVKLFINDILFYGTIGLDRVELINSEYGYLHLNENCDGDFDIFKNSYNVSWEDINERMADDEIMENDLDYNDFVLNTTTYTDVATGHLNFVFEPLARGAGFDHEFRMWLPGTGYVITGDAANVTTDAGNTIVTVYEETRDAFTVNGGFVNVECGGTTGAGIVKTVTIESAPADFTYWLINPFTANLNVNGGPDYDLVLGNLFPPSEFTKGGETFRNGLRTPMGWAWPQEDQDIRDIYGDDFETDFYPDMNTDLLYTNCP